MSDPDSERKFRELPDSVAKIYKTQEPGQKKMSRKMIFDFILEK